MQDSEAALENKVVPQKLKTELLPDSETPPVCTHAKELKARPRRDGCTACSGCNITAKMWGQQKVAW